KLEWTRDIPGDGSTPHFFQAARDIVLIQSGDMIFLHRIADEIFIAGQSTSGTASNLPGSSVFDTLFQNPRLVTSYADGDHPIKIATDGSDFTITDGQFIHFYDASDAGGQVHEQ